MSIMSELDWQIENLACEGMSARAIATELGCPIEIVLGKLEDMGVVEKPQSEEVYSPYYG
jgi:hypothetical protein